MLKRFFLYGMLGVAMEIVWTGLGALWQGNFLLKGFTSLWMLGIYGLALFLEPVHDRIRYRPWWLRGFIWMAIIFTVEYISGFILREALGASPWDYTGDTRWHLQGLIRFDYGPVWFVVGLIFEKVHDLLDRVKID